MRSKAGSGLLAVGLLFVIAAVASAEPQPPYYGRERAVKADKSLLIPPPTDVRALIYGEQKAFVVPQSARADSFAPRRIEVGSLRLNDISRKPLRDRSPARNEDQRPVSFDTGIPARMGSGD